MNAPPALGQDEAFARIRLLRSPNVGPVSYAQLLRRFGDARTALEALPGVARGIAGAPAEGRVPATVGVTASGIALAYPPQNRALQERIAVEGLLIAEQPPGTEPRGSHFPSRNRIIAGLALGTVVVE